MRWLNVNAARGGALAAAFFIGLLVCCSVSTQSARAIECLTSPNQTERGWWSWREIDGRRCWYKKIGAVPPKSEFVWPDQQAKEETQPGEERAGHEPIFMRATASTTASDSGELPLVGAFSYTGPYEVWAPAIKNR
jgi:hypothetical protein